MLQMLLDHMPPAGQGTSAPKILPAIRHTKAAVGCTDSESSSGNPVPTANGNHSEHLSQHPMNGAVDKEHEPASGNKEASVNGHVQAASTAAAPSQHRPANGRLPDINGSRSSASDEGEVGGEVCIGLHLEHSVETCNEQVSSTIPFHALLAADIPEMSLWLS